MTEEKLQRALAKLDEGSYGRCDRCGGPIAPNRRAPVTLTITSFPGQGVLGDLFCSLSGGPP